MKSKRLEDVFEECLTEVLAGRCSIEECQARYPHYAEELQSLISAALDLRFAYAVNPPPNFAEEARRRFVEAARQRAAPRLRQRVTGPALPFWRWVPALGAAVLFLAFLGWISATLLNEDSSLVQPLQVRLASHIEEVKADLVLAEQAVQQGETPHPELIADIRVEAIAIEAILTEGEGELPQDVAAEAEQTLAAADAILETFEPTPTVTPTPSPTPTATATPTTTPTPTITPSATPSPTPSDTGTP